jgi:hypothetical protein
MRCLSAALLLCLPAVSGCFISPFDGTWLFSFDPEPVSNEGTCVQGDDTTTALGTAYELVDIYTNSANGIMVQLEMGLSGTISGKTFTVSGVDEYGDADWSSSDTVDMTGTLDGKVLLGRITDSWVYTSGTDVQNCTTVWSYTAERIDSDPETYVGEEY